jgi:hypothetical protein
MQGTSYSSEKKPVYRLPYANHQCEPGKFNKEDVKLCFQELHKGYVEIEDVTSEEGLPRDRMIVSM